MDLEIKDKVFIVSGGAKGIGEAISLAIAAEGGIPFVVDKDEAATMALIRKIEERGNKALFHLQHLDSPESCQLAVQACMDSCKRIDGLINNAGGNDGIGLESGDPEAWLQSLNKNLHHYYYLAHYALPALKKSQGVILNISSKTAITGQGGTSAYAAAKGAQLALTREWSVELLKYGIRVNSVIPAEVMTDMYRRWIETFEAPDDKIREIERRIPLESRMTKADEIADTVLFLISRRSSHITGQHIFVDGGYSHLDRALSVLKDS